MTLAHVAESAARRGKANQASALPRYDQDIRAAKNGNRKIALHLALDFDFTDDDSCVVGEVLEVDKFSLKIRTEGGREVWISKAFIVVTEVV